MLPALDDLTIAVIGLGYVGLPLAVEFGKRRAVAGFDINRARIDALRTGHDSTQEVTTEELAEARFLQRLTSYRPNTNFRDSIAKFVTWFLEYYVR